MAKDGNWVKVNRNLLEQPFWNEKPFSKGQAWIDILLNVHWKNGYDWVGGRKRFARPGQYWITNRTLAERWGWTLSAVERFLAKLTDTERITLSGTPYGTLLTLKNWALYQHGDTPTDTPADTESEKPTNNIKNKEERTDPLRGDDPDDEGMTEEEWNEFIRVQAGRP